MVKFLRRGTLFSAMIGVAVIMSPIHVEAAEVPIATSSTGEVTEIGTMAARSGGYIGSIYRTSSGKSFDSDWQASAYSGNATLIYGYNTVLINEDYSHAYHTSMDHAAIVGNDNGAFMSSRKAAGKEASIEVRHKGASIEYQNSWYD